MVESLSGISAKTLRVAFVAAVGFTALPGVAHAGFFDDLFGGGQPRQQAPVYNYDMPASADPMPYEIHRQRKKVVVQDDKPVLQKTTDIWHDKTLRGGDAVMMKDGLHVYSGSDRSRHFASDFQRLDKSDEVSSKQKMALLALDGTRNDPLKSGAAPDTIASGRSAAVASPIVSGYAITDARGKAVRYVGP